MERIVPTFNAREMAAWKKAWVAATAGVDYISTFASSDEVSDEISGGASLARTEDNLMKAGFEPLFSPDNDHAAHADNHMGTGSGIVNQVNQQEISPVDADRIMRYLIPHLTEHINFMNSSPLFYRDTLNKLRTPFTQLVQWAKLNRRNAEAMVAAAIRKQQEEEAATNEVLTDVQRKDMVAQSDVARADYKVQQQVERAKQANETRAEIMKEKIRLDADNVRLKTELEAEAKAGATALGRSKRDLLATDRGELLEEMAVMTGSTPSSVDFEPL
jgi:hypothetical protein